MQQSPPAHACLPWALRCLARNRSHRHHRQLALKALAKLEAEGASIPRNPEHPLLSADSFLDGAAAAVPGMADDMRGLARRLGRQLGGCNPDSRRRLLAQRDEYMSCVDLSFVSGQHHAGGGGGALNPREPEQQEL